jgi:hypothetical protein
VHVPDPVVSRADGSSPEDEALLADSVGLALQVVLETLAPAERLAFVLHGAAGVVITLGGQPVAVMGFTVSRGKIAEIDVIIDPERLLRLGLPALDG